MASCRRVCGSIFQPQYEGFGNDSKRFMEDIYCCGRIVPGVNAQRSLHSFVVRESRGEFVEVLFNGSTKDLGRITNVLWKTLFAWDR